MGPLGVPELLIILVLVLIVFGAGRLPDVMSSMGKGVSEFRKASAGEDSTATSENPEAKTEAEPKPEPKPEPPSESAD